jgi:hypothetical protein
MSRFIGSVAGTRKGFPNVDLLLGEDDGFTNYLRDPNAIYMPGDERSLFSAGPFAAGIGSEREVHSQS